jgi:hypothetical protein
VFSQSNHFSGRSSRRRDLIKVNPPRHCLKSSDATRAECDRSGGVGFFMARQSTRQGYYYGSRPIQVLLLRPNDLRFGARTAAAKEAPGVLGLKLRVDMMSRFGRRDY